jgi:hypothetical protein
MRKIEPELNKEAGGGCEGARKTAIFMAVGLLVLFFACAQVEAGGGAGSGLDAIDEIDGGGAGSGTDLALNHDGSTNSGLDIAVVDGGGAGSG